MLIVLYATISGVKIATFLPNVPHVINDISTGIIALLINLIVTFIVSIFTKNIAIHGKQMKGVKINPFL